MPEHCTHALINIWTHTLILFSMDVELVFSFASLHSRSFFNWNWLEKLLNLSVQQIPFAQNKFYWFVFVCFPPNVAQSFSIQRERKKTRSCFVSIGWGNKKKWQVSKNGKWEILSHQNRMVIRKIHFDWILR